MGLASLLGCIPVRGGSACKAPAFKGLSSVCCRRKKAKWCSKPKTYLENGCLVFTFLGVRRTDWGWAGTCSRLQWDSGHLEINQEETFLLRPKRGNVLGVGRLGKRKFG